MIKSRVDVTDRFAQVTLEIERRTIRALNAAAVEAAKVADRQANTPKPIARFVVIPARNIGDGFRSAVKAGPLARIFDHGSLGKRDAKLKQQRPKPSWQVNRGTNPYLARRGDTSDEGIEPRKILTPARKAGRAVLLSRLRGH